MYCPLCPTRMQPPMSPAFNIDIGSPSSILTDSSLITDSSWNSDSTIFGDCDPNAEWYNQIPSP